MNCHLVIGQCHKVGYSFWYCITKQTNEDATDEIASNCYAEQHLFCNLIAVWVELTGMACRRDGILIYHKRFMIL